jgi:hypothetical protein
LAAGGIALKTTNIFVPEIVSATRKFQVTVLFLLLAAAICLAQQPGSNFKRLNPPGSVYSFAFGLNDSAVIVGSYTDAKGVYKGFVYDGTSYKTIVFPGATTFTQANGINDSNVIVGDFIAKDELTHGFMLKSGKFTRFDALKGASTWIIGINKAGNLAGYTGTNGNTLGFIKIGRKVKTFTFQNNSTYALGINRENATVGFFIPPPFITAHGFYRDAKGHMTQIDYPGAIETNCLGITDAGVITGFYVDSQSVAHGFTDKSGVFRTYPLPDIAGMNNKGMYVGSYIAKNGKNYGYVVTAKR